MSEPMTPERIEAYFKELRTLASSVESCDSSGVRFNAVSDKLRDEIDRLRASEATLIKDRDRLRASVRNQAGDNLCWLDDSGVTKIPEQAEFLESCRRYHAQVSGAVGVLTPDHMTIAQLEAEVDRLKTGLEELCRNYNALVELNSHAQGEVIRLEGLVASLRMELRFQLYQWAAWIEKRPGER